VTHRLSLEISTGLWDALAERSRTSGQSVSHIVQLAIAETLDLGHESMYQVSTSGAIVTGLYQGCVTVADLRIHGDVGLGTFENLDGEMIMLDGHCYQARSDGTVVEASDDTLSPFASVVNFAADRTTELVDISSFERLEAQLDADRRSDNGMVSFRIHGHFPWVKVRTACRTSSGVDLVEATSAQATFDFSDISGTLVGFWSPEYIKAISIPGYHLHFISEDRKHGGHVLALEASRLTVEVNDMNHVHLAVPETEEFLHADLAADHSDALDLAERDHSHNRHGGH